jgi:cytosine/adenosine deaminase-related metal-dependent hydrolase
VEPLDSCINNFMAFTGAPLAAALSTVSLHPAAALGLDAVLGVLATGAWADMVLLELPAELREALAQPALAAAPAAAARLLNAAQLQVQVLQSWVGGVLAWSRQAQAQQALAQQAQQAQLG